MELNNIDDISIKCFNEQDMQKLIRLIASGKAILFTGAGFSTGAINIQSNELPMGMQLSKEIDKITEINSHGNLSISSENAIDNNLQDKLINLIKDLFTVRHTQDYHNTIVNLPWRRYYTTNYDTLIREAALTGNKRIKCITTQDSIENNLKEKDLCLHINGNLDSLSEETLNSSFKLSESSYLNNDTLHSSPWVDIFISDLQNASAIVFVGYSLYDYDIKKLLFNNNGLNDKIYFITSEKSCDNFKAQQKFGKVINVGVKGFADMIHNHTDIINDAIRNKQLRYECFKKYTIKDNLEEISHDNIRDFLIYGKYDNNYIDIAFVNQHKNKHLIIPTWMNQVLDEVKKYGNLHITGDIGTGKSVGLNILAAKLANEGEQVFCLDEKYGDYTGDIEHLKSLNTKVYLLVDNAEQNMEVIKYIYRLNSSNIICISCSRKNIDSYFDENSKIKLFPLYKMSDPDISQLITIIENIGAAKSYSEYGLKSFIEKRCEYILANFLLDFLKSDMIAQMIKEQYVKLESLHNNKYQKTLLAINLLTTMNREVSFSTISELACDSNIRSGELLNNVHFKTFYTNRYSKIESKSSIFSNHILKTHYINDIKKKFFINAAIISNEKKLYDNVKDKQLNAEYETIFKELVKFVFISKLFKEDSYDIILRYFEQLKSDICWLSHEPHYWLQLALLNLARGNLPVAKAEIEQAKKVANNKSAYNFDYINTVEARYLLQLSLSSTCLINDAYELFFEADNLLKRTEASDQKYRQINKYIDLYNKIYRTISKEKKDRIKRCISHQIERIKELEHDGYKGIERIYFVHNCESNLNKILQID